MSFPGSDCAARALRIALIDTGARIADRLGDDAPEFMSDYDAERRSTPQTEKPAPDLPLARLAHALDDPVALDVVLTVALAAEDPRIAEMLGDRGRLTVGALVALWRFGLSGDAPQAVRRAIGRLAALDILVELDPDSPRLDRRLVLSSAVLDALGGEAAAPPGCRLVAPQDLVPLAALVLDAGVRRRVEALAMMLADEADLVVAIRGPAHNGRRTLAGALAHALGRPLLIVETDDATAWRQAGLYAWLTDAVLLTAPALGPGETRDLPPFALEPVRMAVACGGGGGVRVADRPVTTVTLPMPALDERIAHWAAALPHAAAVSHLARAFQLTSGTIRRAARGAQALARQDGRDAPTRADVRLALRDLQDSRLETVAARVDTGDVGEFLAIDDATREDLLALDTRCRNREALAPHAGRGPGALGVRALFAGPSGAGKTLAARRLATDLQRDLWRIDLSATVSKYIGETEKALDRAFAAAEELDAILLIDEGDALMAKRTDVGNANDRYANLETNFLLQRIESFSGILIVTTNAADRIDAAFSRRMDAVVQFRAPDEVRRYEILDRHLGDHRVSDDLVQEIAVRCALSGGQLRNVALHARLLALDRQRAIGDHELREALVREYRKTEAHCPLKPLLAAVG